MTARLATTLLVLLLANAHAETLTIAVASNFRAPAEAIASQFMQDTGHTVRISAASTGKLYAQILNGAPFDVLLAADTERPRLLGQSRRGIGATRRTYAIGRLVLWSWDPAYAGVNCRAALEGLGKKRLAIANPATAPYGVAASQFLHAEKRWDAVARHLVYGESIGQTLHFVASGNAALGLIAASQAQDPRLPQATCAWRVPAEFHDPLEQQAIVINREPPNEAAFAFLDYLGGAAARQIIRDYGYEVPE